MVIWTNLARTQISVALEAQGPEKLVVFDFGDSTFIAVDVVACQLSASVFGSNKNNAVRLDYGTTDNEAIC
jgi:hypothetical protein